MKIPTISLTLVLLRHKFLGYSCTTSFQCKCYSWSKLFMFDCLLISEFCENPNEQSSSVYFFHSLIKIVCLAYFNGPFNLSKKNKNSYSFLFFSHCMPSCITGYFKTCFVILKCFAIFFTFFRKKIVFDNVDPINRMLLVFVTKLFCNLRRLNRPWAKFKKFSYLYHILIGFSIEFLESKSIVATKSIKSATNIIEKLKFDRKRSNLIEKDQKVKLNWLF